MTFFATKNSDTKIDYVNVEQLGDFINTAYFLEGDRGRINLNDKYIAITPSNPLYESFKGLGNFGVRLQAENIDGHLRMLVKEQGDEVHLYPTAIYCVILENGKYSFY